MRSEALRHDPLPGLSCRRAGPASCGLIRTSSSRKVVAMHSLMNVRPQTRPDQLRITGAADRAFVLTNPPTTWLEGLPFITVHRSLYRGHPARCVGWPTGTHHNYQLKTPQGWGRPGGASRRPQSIQWGVSAPPLAGKEGLPGPWLGQTFLFDAGERGRENKEYREPRLGSSHFRASFYLTSSDASWTPTAPRKPQFGLFCEPLTITVQ